MLPATFLSFDLDYKTRIQGFGGQKLKTAEKIPFFFVKKLQFFLSLDRHERYPNYRRSLQPPKENIQIRIHNTASKSTKLYRAP
jgi:hypothetical protein